MDKLIPEPILCFNTDDEHLIEMAKLYWEFDRGQGKFTHTVMSLKERFGLDPVKTLKGKIEAYRYYACAGVQSKTFWRGHLCVHGDFKDCENQIFLGTSERKTFQSFWSTHNRSRISKFSPSETRCPMCIEDSIRIENECNRQLIEEENNRLREKERRNNLRQNFINQSRLRTIDYQTLSYDKVLMLKIACSKWIGSETISAKEDDGVNVYDKIADRFLFEQIAAEPIPIIYPVENFSIDQDGLEVSHSTYSATQYEFVADKIHGTRDIGAIASILENRQMVADDIDDLVLFWSMYSSHMTTAYIKSRSSEFRRHVVDYGAVEFSVFDMVDLPKTSLASLKYSAFKTIDYLKKEAKLVQTGNIVNSMKRNLNWHDPSKLRESTIKPTLIEKFYLDHFGIRQTTKFTDVRLFIERSIFNSDGQKQNIIDELMSEFDALTNKARELQVFNRFIDNVKHNVTAPRFIQSEDSDLPWSDEPRFS